MAETIISPGVLQRENDQSQITQQPVSVGAAVLGPTVKGKPNIPTVVTSYGEFLSKFGGEFSSGSGGDQFSYLTSISAFNYFQNGGTTLSVTRIASGTFTPATSSAVGSDLTNGIFRADAEVNSLILNGLNLITGSAGTYTVEFTGSAAGTGATATIILDSGTTVSSIDVTTGGTGYLFDDTVTIPSQSVGFAASATSVGTDITLQLTGSFRSILQRQESFVLETLSEGDILNNTAPDGGATEGTNGALVSGSEDNVRWEVANPDTSRGTFSLIIRRGDDIQTQKSILETYDNVTLDPKSSNYIERVIGNQVQTLRNSGTTDVYLQTTGSFPNASRYVRVKSVLKKTPDYLDNNGDAKTAFTASIPVAQSGTFGDAQGAVYVGANSLYEKINDTRTQGLIGSNYTDAINLHANKDDFTFNLISVPGLYKAGYSTQVNRLIEVCENRGDTMAIVDLVPFGSTVSTVTAQAATLNTSFAAAYWPWTQITDPNTGELVQVPASTLLPGVYAFTDSVSEPWFAPAGINRGGLTLVNQAERKLTQANRDTLYNNKVNPIATFPGRGVVVFGQKTLQTKASALDRVNVRRLLIALKSFIGQVADNLVFEQNTAATRNNFLAQVNPYLDSVQQRQGLFAFKVVMDESNNTPDVIDRNQLVGQIFLQPTRTAEFIILDFNILPTGAEFPS
jgi:phage tail sheath protein FI